MFWFRIVVQVTLSFVTSALSALMLEHRWGAVLTVALVAASAIVILSIAVVIADKILGRHLRKK